MVFGSYIHRILERGYTCKSLEEIILICKEEKENYKFSGHSDNEISKTIQNFFLWNRNLSETVGIEYEYNLELVEGINLIGFIDRILKSKDGSYLIIDYKTGRPKTVLELTSNKQGMFYSWVIHKVFNVPYTNITFGHYYPVTNEFVAVKYSSAKVENFIYKELVKKIWDLRGKKKEDLKPRRNKYCGNCGYRKICPLFCTQKQLDILLLENEQTIKKLQNESKERYKKQREQKNKQE